jgi:hypothetical protein
LKTILKKVVTTNFTVIPNYLTEDPDLSWKAKGILVYLLGRPNDWEINIPHLSSVSSDGESSTRSGFSELEDSGYATRVRHTDEAGRIISWSVYVRQDKNDPWPFENPDVENPHVEKPHVENRHQLNKDNTNKDITKKEKTKTASLDDDVNQVWSAYIESLERFKPNKKKPVLSKSRIDLIKRRLKDYSVENLILAVTGWEHSEFHCGKNDNGKIWNSIELLLRSSEKIEQFMEYHSSSNANSVNADWGREKMKIKSTTILSNDDDV